MVYYLLKSSPTKKVNIRLLRDICTKTKGKCKGMTDSGYLPLREKGRPGIGIEKEHLM